MTRFHASAAALLVGTVLLAGCGVGSREGRAGPEAILGLAAPRTVASPSLLAQGSVSERHYINQVRVGHGLDIYGKVPPSFGASRFAVGDPIHMSLWQVTDEQASAVVRVSVRDALTNQVVWSGEKTAPPGGSYLSFGIGRALARGKYRMDVIIGEDVVSRTGFEVRYWKE